MKPAAFKATPQLSTAESQALLKVIGVTLTPRRRAELKASAMKASAAFSRPLKMNAA
jgi:hypothetical protein